MTGSWAAQFLAVMLMIFGSEQAFIISKEEKETTNTNNIETNWAVLVAGSSSWTNYRHQADICHAYQIFIKNGIPKSNIVVMMYDDIAFNRENIYQGYIRNQVKGPNLYKGVLKDYTHEDVTPENFINVLRGNEDAMKGIGSGRVIKSGPNDRIFVNLVDHGGAGVFCFPDAYLTAEHLVGNITAMYRNEQFKEMVLYIESCESGSLFNQLLPDDINVLAVTASNPSVSSWACCWDPIIDNYVGDLFSVVWMEDTEIEDTKKETLEEQYKIIVNYTSTKDTPSRYGELTISKEKLNNYFGHREQVGKNIYSKNDDQELKDIRIESAVKSTDVPFYILENKLRTANSVDEENDIQSKIIQLHKNRIFLKNKVEEIVMRITMKYDLVMKYMNEQSTHIYNWKCYSLALKDFHDNCFNLGKNSYALQFVGIFSNLCNHGYLADEIQQAIIKVCDHPKVNDIT